MRRRIFVLLAAVGAIAVAADLATQIESSLSPRIRTDGTTWTLAERMALYSTPGVSIAVVRAGKIVLAKGYGVVESGGRAVDPETLFQAASISKPVAALAALHMMQYGNFTLDENVNSKLKSWKVPDNEFTATEKVTLRRLLSHSAGLTVHGFPGYAQGDPLPTVPQILDGVKPANTAPVRVDIVPGSKWRYSGGGFTIVQQLLIDRLNKPFPEIMQMTVLKNAGMTRSTYQQPLPPALAANAARGYRSNGNKVEGNWHTYPEMAAAGLWTTPSDLARFGIEVWKASRGESNKIIERKTAKEMLTKQKGDYGLGVGIEGEGPARWFGHGGANEGYRCNWIMFEESGNGAVVMTNSDRGDRLAGEIIRAIAVTEKWPALQPEKKTPIKLDPSTLAEYAGTYKFAGPTIVIKVNGDRLMATLPDSRTIQLFAESQTKFFSEDTPALEFHKVAGGIELEARGERAKRQRP